MALLRRSRKDDVDVESFVENLHRVAHVATMPLRRVIDLRRSDDADATVSEERANDAVDAPNRR